MRVIARAARVSRRMMMSTAAHPTKNYDVVVVGGGVVGLTFAAELSQRVKGLKIVVLESKAPRALEECINSASPDPRVYALSPKSRKVLDRLGAWQGMSSRNQPYYHMQVWDANSQGMIRFSAQQMGTPDIGCIAENSTLQSALYERLKQSQHHADIEFIFGNALKHISPSKNNNQSSFARDPVQLTLANADTLTAKLVVAGDGAESFVRKSLNMPTWGWGYGQTAIVATVSVDVENTTAWQRYLPTGPLALLPLWGGMSSIVWSTTPEMAAELHALSDGEFVHRLNEALQQPPNAVTDWSAKQDRRGGGVLRAVSQVLEGAMASSFLTEPFRTPPLVSNVQSKRLSFPLRLSQASTYIAPRVALIGDAAHSVHPMAGQGLNLGVLDAVSLASVLEQGARSGADLGSLTLLEKYDRDRRPKNQTMLLLLDSLHRVYGLSNPAASYIRGVGMLGLHGFGLLKGQVTKFAMGLDEN